VKTVKLLLGTTVTACKRKKTTEHVCKSSVRWKLERGRVNIYLGTAPHRRTVFAPEKSSRFSFRDEASFPGIDPRAWLVPSVVSRAFHLAKRGSADTQPSSAGTRLQACGQSDRPCHIANSVSLATLKMTIGTQDAPLPFNLTALDRQILAQTDEEFHSHSWDELRDIIGECMMIDKEDSLRVRS
jgi:hypothetical protein